MIIKQKKAQAHVEEILSFVIFAGFVFTLLIFLNPVGQKSTSTTVLDFTERQIIDNLSISYEKVPLILDNAPQDINCFYVNNSRHFTGNILVKDSQEQIKKFKILDGDSRIYIETSLNERYYIIYYNSSLNDYPLASIASCNQILAEDYSFGLTDKTNSVLYENLISFNNSYNENYEALKTNLHLNNEFVFSVFQNNSLIMNAERQKPSARNILSRNIPLLAVDRNLSRTDIILNLRVWE